MTGRALIESCVEHNKHVVAIIRPGTKRKERLKKFENRIDVVECDLKDINKVVLPTKVYDTFFHIGWEVMSQKDRNGPIMQSMNIMYTLNAVDVAKKYGCNKFVGVGSQAEYGKVSGIITPDLDEHPETAYGISKLAANKLSNMLCQRNGIKHIWGRIFSEYGCYDNEYTMLSYAFRQFVSKQKAFFSAATQTWNYLNEKDVGEMLFLLGETDVAEGIYHIANTESKVLKEYIEEFADVFDAKELCVYAKTDEMQGAFDLIVDMDKTVKAIEYVPQITFRRGAEIIKERKM